ncbi:alpha/beta hydrolase [Sanguibacter inulinus]|uniref:Alpha/beta-hydrolase family protein n=1 Tax=Sanguibacter inulinus TaxID=60922 RepID=A0A853EY77_9MICO|nr:alpha/beta hydrolase [Sanguibacter inulinus]MBF0724185.1 alpha/beta-hydrolase family protein [Sanguibacter inulinus]NYS95330.1 alpha/beta-hydrolase family protein [Sanguibacter inulinus]
MTTEQRPAAPDATSAAAAARALNEGAAAGEAAVGRSTATVEKTATVTKTAGAAQTADSATATDPTTVQQVGTVSLGEAARRSWHRWASHINDPRLPPVPKTPHWWSLHGVGAWFGVIFYSWSMSASLLPRPWYLQALATGICVALGYGVGVSIATLLRRLGFSPDWKASRRRWAWIVLAVVTAVVVPLAFFLGGHAQTVTAELVGMPVDNRWFHVLAIPVAALVAVALIGLFRALIQLGKIFARFGSRFVPVLPAKIFGTVTAVVVAVLLVQDGVLPGILAVGGRLAAQTDQAEVPGVEQPVDPERSGSPDSLVDWDGMGRNGKVFVAGGPTVDELEEFSGEPAMTPVRAYAGLETSDDLREVAATVVAELAREGGFDREVLAVATTTGSGWVNEAPSTSLEYLHNGDTAIAAMQYSYLPSPLAFIADRETPENAGRALFEAVYAVWDQMPEDSRPKLVVFGESLGSYGGQAAFSGVDDMAARVDGALWIGSPNFSEPWGRITDERDAGSPERLPVVDGGDHVRFVDTPDGLTDLGPWEAPRIVYLQHATDPVVWWSPDLILRQPDWLKDDLAPSVNPDMQWYPFVTFWQVTVDMVFSIDMPDGYGHSYELGTVDSWAAIVPPEGWTAADTSALREWVAEPGA